MDTHTVPLLPSNGHVTPRSCGEKRSVCTLTHPPTLTHTHTHTHTRCCNSHLEGERSSVLLESHSAISSPQKPCRLLESLLRGPSHIQGWSQRCECVCVCVCERERERERESVCLCVKAYGHCIAIFYSG